MLPLVCVGLLLAGKALAQQEHAIEGYMYRGCGKLLGTHRMEEVLTPNNCSPEECQLQCKDSGFHFAAVYVGYCRCYDRYNEVIILSEGQCENFCVAQDPNVGKCGSCDNSGNANVYECITSTSTAGPADVQLTSTSIVVVPVPTPVTISTSISTSTSVWAETTTSIVVTSSAVIPAQPLTTCLTVEIGPGPVVTSRTLTWVSSVVPEASMPCQNGNPVPEQVPPSAPGADHCNPSQGVSAATTILTSTSMVISVEPDSAGPYGGFPSQAPYSSETATADGVSPYGDGETGGASPSETRSVDVAGAGAGRALGSVFAAMLAAGLAVV